MNKTTFLFKTPSFVNGMARSIDLFGSFNNFNDSRSGVEADARAFAADWSAAMGDLSSAYEEAAGKIGKK